MEVRRFDRVDGVEFQEKVWSKREPAILCGLDLGKAQDLWSPDYLSKKVGNQTVKVHVCPEPQMDFITKNFVYRTLPFQDFVCRSSRKKNMEYFLSPDECYYLRSLGSGDARKSVADFPMDYPSLAADLKLPTLFPQHKYFSSVLRVGSAGMQLWTHYDVLLHSEEVMDNLLVQVVGTKRVVLFPPSDAPYLYLEGDKSKVTNIDSPDLDKFPEFSRVQRYVAVLQPGEVLFLPALWFHHVTALEFGVAVNVFWRHLEEKFYDSRDPYGNKAPPQVQRAMQAVEKAAKMLGELPADHKEFYGGRLVALLQRKLESETGNVKDSTRQGSSI